MGSPYTMHDILWLLNIPYDQSKRSFYMPCPDCDPNNKKHGHLNINLEKNCFRCPKCGYHGGMLDFYARFSNCSRESAREDVMSRLGLTDTAYGNNGIKTNQQDTAINIPAEAPASIEFPLNDIEVRDATYSALLEKLTLASDHKADLLNRGLTEQAIIDNQYRTTPAFGFKTIARNLHENGYYLSGVPGFYRNEDNEWVLIGTERGILVPVRDVKGRIQGLQIRLDNKKKGKFRWLSSTDRPDGCKAESWVHVAGPVREEMLLLEGPMKGDIVYHLSGLSSFDVTGVHSQSQLEILLRDAKNMGVKSFMTAFDMDMLKNQHVQEAFNNLAVLLDNYDYPFGTYLWHPDRRYNGLDDYIWKWCLNQRHPMTAVI